jgi:beta-lactamase class A
MTPLARIAAAMLLAASISPSSAIPADSPARGDIQKLIQSTGGRVSLAFHAIDGDQDLFLDADDRFDDPNALRLPIMIELYAEAEAGELKLSEPVTIHDGVHISPDVAPYHIDRRADPSMAGSVGKTRTLGELCDEMIYHNSDFATNLLIERLTLSAILQRIASLGARAWKSALRFRIWCSITPRRGRPSLCCGNWPASRLSAPMPARR